MTARAPRRQTRPRAGSNAARAAATARSTSARLAWGETPIDSSVIGEMVWKVSVLAGATHSPPMNRRSRVMP